MKSHHPNWYTDPAVQNKGGDKVAQKEIIESKEDAYPAIAQFGPAYVQDKAANYDQDRKEQHSRKDRETCGVH